MICAQIPSEHGGSSRNHPNKVVVHAMGEFIENGDADLPAWDLLKRLRFSAHVFVTPSGVIIRSRKDSQRAYHAKGHNSNSLGVEFLVPGVHTYGTFLAKMKTEYLHPAQYASGLGLVRGWVDKYSLRPSQIVRHSDISPGRKHDPGDGFPWEQFVKDLFA